MACDRFASICCCGMTSCVCFVIWLVLFFGIFYPFFREFREADCIITNRWYMFSSYDQSEPLHKYRLLRVSLEVDGEKYYGFGCESDAYQLNTLETDSPFGAFPFSCPLCDDWNNSTAYDCDNDEQIMPRWLCSDWSNPSKFLVGKNYDCKYAVTNAGRNDYPEDVDLYEKFPHDEDPYIQVIFEDEPYYAKIMYWFVMIVILGMLSILPFCITVFILLPKQCNWKPYKIVVAIYTCVRFCCRKTKKMLRKYVFAHCWKYYDPDVVVGDRRMLFQYALMYGEKSRFNLVLGKMIYEYIHE